MIIEGGGGRDFVIREWTLLPYPDDQAPPHRHLRGDEAFYVLDGTVEFLVGAERRTARAGEQVFIPRGTAHTFANRGPGEARVLVVMSPEVDALVSALHQPGLDDAGRAEVWRRHHAEVVADPALPSAEPC